VKTEAAILWPDADQWSVEEIDLDPPKTADEVLVRYVASGMCHSDEHALTGDLPAGPFRSNEETKQCQANVCGRWRD